MLEIGEDIVGDTPCILSSQNWRHTHIYKIPVVGAHLVQNGVQKVGHGWMLQFEGFDT